MKNKNVKICICISNSFGFKILNILKKKFTQVDVVSNTEIGNTKITKVCKNKKSFFKFLENKKYDFLILVYWPFIIKEKYFKYFKNSINFHPSYLPYGRGWYPHIHSINNNFPLGVTLHKIDKGVDTGPIWVQKKISKKSFYTSDSLYTTCQKELLKIFKVNFEKIISKKIKPKKVKKKLRFFKITDIKKYNELNLRKTYKAENLIKLILSRQYKKKSHIYLKFKGIKKKIFMKLM
jgi:methionyl-tRNA formyltransferase